MERMKSNPLFATPRGGCSESERKSQNEFSILCPPSAPPADGWDPNCPTPRQPLQQRATPALSRDSTKQRSRHSAALGQCAPTSDLPAFFRRTPYPLPHESFRTLLHPSRNTQRDFRRRTQHRPFARQLQHIDEHRWQAPKPDSEGEDAGGPDSWRTILTIQGGDVLAPKDCTHDTTDQSLVATPTYNAQDAVAASA